MPDDLISQQSAYRQVRLPSGGSALLFNVSIVLFILVLVAWGGLYFFERSLNTNDANWRDQIASLENELRPDLLNQLVQLSTRIGAVRDIITGHLYSSNIFTLLGQDTHPQVQFTMLQYSADTRKIDLSGKAASYSAVAAQVTAFEADPQVESVSFGGLQLDDKGLVNFKIAVVFKQSLLQLRPQ